MTYKEMCEFISDTYKKATGNYISPEEIFNASPTGELFHVHELYAKSLMIRHLNTNKESVE